MSQLQPSPTSLVVLHALSRDSLSSEDTYNAVEGIRHMAGHAIIATLEAHEAEINAKFDAQQAELATLRGVVGLGLAAQGVLMTLLRLFG